MQVREFVLNAKRGQAVKNAKLLFAQTLVRAQLENTFDASALHERLSRFHSPHIGRKQQHLRRLHRWQVAESMAQALGLLPAQLRQRNIDVARRNVDDVQAAGLDCIARRVAGALAAANNPQDVRKFRVYGFFLATGLAER